jgi:hypothetical protein
MPSTFPVKVTSELDATEEMAGRKLKAGDTEIKAQSASGLRLIVRAVSGKKLTYRVVDASGKTVSETLAVNIVEKTRAPRKAKTTCWECGVDAQGNRHCWKVPCPDIVGPWVPGKLIRA